MSDSEDNQTTEQSSIQHLQLQSSPDSLFPPIADAEPSNQEISPSLEVWSDIRGRGEEEPEAPISDFRMQRRPTMVSNSDSNPR